MNDYFWMTEPRVKQREITPTGLLCYSATGQRSDGEWFMTSITRSRLDAIMLRSKEQEWEMLAETMKQLARGMESFLDPECICRVGQTEECPVRHPRKN